MNALLNEKMSPVPSAASAAELLNVSALPEPSDHELMISVRDGETRRLGELFERHHGPLYGFFVHMTGQRTLSEDLVQLVFYRILKYRHTYRDEGKFSAWMYHLARKVAADHFRKETPAGRFSVEESHLEHFPDDSANAGERAAQDDDLRLMRAALARMPVEQREILTLHRLQHVAHEDIAQLLDCSVSATKVRLHRAIKVLRETYQTLCHQGETR